MKNYVTYTDSEGNEIRLRLPASRAVELEEKLGDSIPEKVAELDKLSVSAEFIAAMLPGDDYPERKKNALKIYDEMIESGKRLSDYEFLIMDVLVAAGFMRGEAVEIQKLSEKRQETALAGMLQKSLQKASEQESAPVSDIPTTGE